VYNSSYQDQMVFSLCYVILLPATSLSISEHRKDVPWIDQQLSYSS
jgi:hypothetical protein